jgi:hypothetical protein
LGIGTLPWLRRSSSCVVCSCNNSLEPSITQGKRIPIACCCLSKGIWDYCMRCLLLTTALFVCRRQVAGAGP